MSEKSFEDRIFGVDLSDVDVTSAEAIADLLELQPGEEVSNLGETEVAPVDDAAPVAPSAVPTKESSESPPAASETLTEIAGVLTKDGKHVIPHSVLTSERKEKILYREDAAAQRLRAEAAERALEDMRAGKTADSDVLTETMVADAERDFPEHGKALRATFEKLKTFEAKAKPESRNIDQEADEEARIAEALDVAIAGRPLLAKYRNTGGVVWQRACELDNQLAAANPDINQRFAEVEKQLAAELGIQLSTPNQQAAVKAAPARPRATPTPAEVMPTLTDFTGSGVSIKSDDPFNGATDGQMVDKAMSMDLNDLRAMVGLS